MNDLTADTSAPPAAGEGTLSSPRLAQFEAEVTKLKVTGGGANPERLGAQWGIGLTIVGFVVLVISWFTARQDTVTQYILRDVIGSLIGFAIVIVGLVIWVRNSLTRYLRYWIIRLVHEQREQTDAMAKALREK